MEAQTLNQHHIDPRRDERRNKSLVRMEVENRNTLALQVLQNTIGIGRHTITVYEDEVPKVMAMVEDRPELLVQAQLDYELEMAEQTLKGIGFGGTAEEMLQAIKAGTNEEAVKEYKRLERTGPLSPEGMFRRRNKRGMKALNAARVIEGSEHAEPQREELDREVQRQAGAFAAAIDGAVSKVIAALAGRSAPSEADIEALVKAKVAEMLGEKPSKK